MAKIKLGALISDIRGSVGGQTIQNSSSGLVLKTKPNMGKSIKPFTTASFPGLNYSQTIRKSAFSEFSSLWNNISSQSQANWNYFAANNPYKSSKSGSYVYTGRDYFIAFHVRMRLHASIFFNIILDPYFDSSPPLRSEMAYEIIGGNLFAVATIFPSSGVWRGFVYFSSFYNSSGAAARSNWRYVLVQQGNSDRSAVFLPISQGFITAPVSGQYQKVGIKMHNPASGQIAAKQIFLAQYNL